ncbi:hypothetical protein [Pseudarthrobacter sp. SSS035]|uniref:hypothetical protein n=1 Tax=Pseudarthrobacter sp. SSS035 TaxID=2931399 RepID=UPI00200C8702|nr:hypothetical protein [Pseudarthrobacter sp. SSS035]
MRNLGCAVFVAIFAVLTLALSGCDRTFDPDMRQRDSTAKAVIAAAMDDDRPKLLDLAAVDMTEREAAADRLIVKASNLTTTGYEVQYKEHHGAPDNYIVTATDDQGRDLVFELDWHEAKWQLILGTAGPPKSPATSP